MQNQASETYQTAQSPPRWQTGLLLLMLLAFLAASYALLQPNNQEQGNVLPPILYLAEDDAGLLQMHQATLPNWQPEQLTRETADILNYAPSPDGRQIAYVASLPNGTTQIKLIDLKNSAASSLKTVLICENAECSQLLWHPDGRRLLYERREPPNFGRPQLWWLDTVTGETLLLLEAEAAVSSNARFSPDGNWVSFATSPDEGVRLYNFEDGRSLTFPSDVGTPAAWHPFGSQPLIQNSRTIVFHGENNDDHSEHSHDFTTAVSLFQANLDTEETTLLSSDGAFDDGSPAWSPDGEWIAFGRRLARTNTGRQLWLMRADGTEAHALTEKISVHFGPPSWSPNGRFLLFQQFNSITPDKSPTIWLLEVARGEFTQVTNSGLLPTFLTHESKE